MEKLEIKNTTVNSENREKISKYVDDIVVIAKKIPTDEFDKAFDDVCSINPKIDECWNVISMGHDYSRYLGVNWWDYMSWDVFLPDYEPELIEFIKHFKTIFPTYF